MIKNSLKRNRVSQKYRDTRDEIIYIGIISAAAFIPKNTNNSTVRDIIRYLPSLPLILTLEILSEKRSNLLTINNERPMVSMINAAGEDIKESIKPDSE